MFDALCRAGLAALGLDGADALPLPRLVLRIQRFHHVFVPARMHKEAQHMESTTPCMPCSLPACVVMCHALSTSTITSDRL